MSRLHNIQDFNKQIPSDPAMIRNQTADKVKKVPPAVPPKKKPQPQVPHSTVVSNIQEPSFSTKIPALNNNVATRSYAGPATLHTAQYSYIKDTDANSSPVRLHTAQYSYIKDTDVNPSPATLHTAQYSYINNTDIDANPYSKSSVSTQKNQNITYANILPHRRTDDELPPPPPPLPPMNMLHSETYSDNQVDEYLPPPSPVSSNYSELVRATTNLSLNDDHRFAPTYQNDYRDYGDAQTSTYESFYEPINPHPQTNSCDDIHKNQLNSYPNSCFNNSKTLPKEEEVDALTNLLVKSISESQDLDVFGTCVKCNEKVIGEGSGCTAMGYMYHVQCFSCFQCNTNLQGKTFHAVEGQPYCENDYYESLEKCSVCYKPILDRILRATGNPYHPTCFTCVVCGKSLDGIPFTVDAMNQIHCIEDFHKKFAPRCCVCKLPIMPEEGEEETVRVVALDRSFHVRCYRCEDCGLLLSSEAEGRGCYPLDDHILCKECNAHRIRLLTNVMTTDL